mmetsp:Transcript_6362/g.18778  ORF Transcript_6362/g.18778 Transcript_6362/m.18778 type:complete len:371 (-) Transcript_6362:52-1164(-)|eukprot:CAMPEP_0119272204 /NCGR_PEP_ID=MMETSP1329-20130426/8472_1 /TAXON_ID=114041 /ORGANISM="Genus nov. species nov., Strain RCC1024" /LENGTH=370 /DNA_ID=CAMNT_0007272259 /DNA_START=306 /DNA_END=1418 /DNA_ORIENTATION=+
MRRLLVGLVALAAGSRAAETPRQIKAAHGSSSAPAISAAVAALRASKHSCGLRGREPTGGLLVFTRQRSGSRWFVDTLGERSGTRHRGPKEGVAVESHLHELSIDPKRKGHKSMAQAPHHKYCERAEPSKLCSCALREVFHQEIKRVQKRYAAHRTARGRDPAAAASDAFAKAPGYKYMMNHRELKDTPPRLTALVASVCDLRTPWVIFLRRNGLRRAVSKAANKYHESQNLRAHVHDASQMGAVRAYKPVLRAAELVEHLRTEAADHRAIADLFRLHCGGEWDVARRVHYYEDLVDVNPHSHRNWGEVLYELGASDTPNATAIQARLGGWPRANQSIIHGSRPVLETIGNPEEVVAALTGTEFEWMLKG